MQRSPATDAAAAVFGLGVPSSSSKHIVSATTPPATTPPFHRTPSSWHRRHPTSHDWSRLRDAATAASTEAATPAFDRSLASVLGSPFLTTAVPLPSSSYTSAELLLDIVDGASVAVPRTETVTRPPSPAPTADYSMVSIPSMPSISATIFAARGRARDQDQHPERNRTPRPGVFSTPSRLNLAQYLASTTPSLSIPASSRKRSRAPSPAKAKGLIPRLFGSLSAPHKKGKHKAIPSFALDDDNGHDDPDLAPLDGEEGELVDEACFFIDGDSPPSPTPEPELEEEPVWIDPFSVLPPELALRVLGLLGVEDIVHCVRVCRAWRTLGLDNLLWSDLFASKAPDGWKLDCTRMQGNWNANGSGGANGKRRPVGVRERKPSERSIASTLARARKNSTRSLMSWRSGKGSTSAPDTLDTMDEETPGESPQLTPDWKKLYETRLALDKRWLHAEPEITKITGHTDR
jgi:F-box and WD-40 domain protein 1/11